jgi:hypothetical protein
MFGAFARGTVKPPKATGFWNRRAPFARHAYGNTEHNDCTIAKQAVAMLRMERLETGHVPQIAEDEPLRVFEKMCADLYGGNDEGAYETDALDRWRRPELSIRDASGRALTIDAYVRVNHLDQQEVRRAIASSGAHGIAVCLALPKAFESISPPKAWDIPVGQPAIGDWLPNSGGGHSMWARDYDENGIWLVHTWREGDQLLTWKAAECYLVEAHTVIDSLDAWQRDAHARKRLDLKRLKKAVNDVSSHPIA